MFNNMPDLSQANCSGIDTEMFYPEKHTEYAREINTAKRVCSFCKVQKECLEWALYNEAHGVWGGTTPKQRRAIRQKRKISLALV